MKFFLITFLLIINQLLAAQQLEVASIEIEKKVPGDYSREKDETTIEFTLEMKREFNVDFENTSILAITDDTGKDLYTETDIQLKRKMEGSSDSERARYKTQYILSPYNWRTLSGNSKRVMGVINLLSIPAAEANRINVEMNLAIRTATAESTQPTEFSQSYDSLEEVNQITVGGERLRFEKSGSASYNGKSFVRYGIPEESTKVFIYKMEVLTEDGKVISTFQKMNGYHVEIDKEKLIEPVTLRIYYQPTEAEIIEINRSFGMGLS